MIDLRSDTLTLPDKFMLETILTAPLGDDGRLNANGRGEDQSVNQLEDFCAELTGKEAGLLCASGTMGNQIALMTWCQPGDKVLLEERQHIYVSEKTAFDKRFTRLEAVFYQLDKSLMPDIEDMREKLFRGGIELICIENTHNFSGGACIDLNRMKEIKNLADTCHVPVHMDGARLFNAARHLHTSVKELCRYADSTMFCFSKGLGAPVGSMLCGSRDFINKAKKLRKLMGGGLRQSGIIAVPAMYALGHNIERLEEDHMNCYFCAERLRGMNHIKVQKNVQTNILMLDISGTGISQKEFCARLKAQGVWVGPVLDKEVRLVFYKGISREMVLSVARIIKEFDSELR